ncbi:Coenzyme F420:L-glutamate ligase [Zhongshania aliphaticivorans]|uniref:Coenzyme F420:L-glutamate ligase n=2 Tax=Zhongshania aliphaticivorans TaxID=1470434 RepID=A0A5S9MUC0_9GAMM|nr:Coenzyme F420:L-glutamate ligase [Zhongshania aliphaticivorans]CAA0086011.1 Coenzyme F420:L-glutamate ligase [Zhongshania aliphaticivorans]
MVLPGDDLVDILLVALSTADIALQDGDVLVLAQKIVSKAENRYAYLKDVEPSEEACALAKKCDKDPRHMQLLLNESREVIRARPGVVIVEHELGYVHANAGIDRSNIDSDDDNPRLLLLPKDPDRSAALLKSSLQTRLGVEVNIIINDSAGRAWRNGTLGFALGTAGFEAVENRVGELDIYGRPLEVTEVAVADELAAGASFLMGQGSEALPVVLIRGANLRPSSQGSAGLIRDREKDMFR